MESRIGVRLSGPLEPYSRGFWIELRRQGYSPSATQHQLGLMAHLSRWLISEGLEVAELSPAAVSKFLGVRRTVGYRGHLSSRALDPLLGYLRCASVLPEPQPPTLTPVGSLLQRYQAYLTEERGLAGDTVRSYTQMVRPFLEARATPSTIDLAGLTAGEVTRLVVEQCRHRNRGSAQVMVTALRSLLGFLHLQGVVSSALGSAVPGVARWRLAGLPRALEPRDVRRLLASCDRRTEVGRRNRAMLLLLVRLGLRASEVVALRLDDLDWRAGDLIVRGKGNRAERLPLTVDVGEAVAGYLSRGRLPGGEPRLFLRVCAPRRPVTRAAVTGVVRTAARRAGLPPIGPHTLRHTAATLMLRAGASLTEIGQLLRHRRSLTTAIYAKVDRDALRQIARSWPGGAA